MDGRRKEGWEEMEVENKRKEGKKGSKNKRKDGRIEGK